jgi:Fe(3+) dicitrate transport protein
VATPVRRFALLLHAPSCVLIASLAGSTARAQLDGAVDPDAGIAPDAGVMEAPAEETPSEVTSEIEDPPVAPEEITVEDEIAIDDEVALDDEELAVEGIVVTHSAEELFRLGGSAFRLDEEELAALSYDDPHQTLLRVPGVYVRSEDGFGLRPNIGLRGANPNRSQKVTLMEDGVLFGPAPYAAPAAYYFPLIGRMVGIEIFKGPGALIYGPQTVGGAINFLTRDVPNEPEGAASVRYGLYHSRHVHLHWGTSNELGGVLFEVLDVGSDGFHEIDGSDRNTGFDRIDAMARGFLQTDAEEEVYHRFELKVGFGREHSNETYLGTTDADLEANPDRRYPASEFDRMEWWRTQASLGWRMDAGDHVSLVTQLYRHDFYRSWFRFNRFAGGPDPFDVLTAPTGARAVYLAVLRGEEDSSSSDEALLLVDNQRRFVSQGIQSTLELDFETGEIGHGIEAGLRVHQDQVARDHQETSFVMRSARLVPDGVERPPLTDNFALAFAVAAHAVYTIEVADLTVSGGARLETIYTRLEDDLASAASDAVDVVVLPGLGASYAFTDEIAILAGVYRGFSPVAPGQPEEVEPELSVNYELGARYSDSDRDRLIEAIGFLNHYQNLTGACTVSSGCDPDMLDRQFNGGEALIWGVEVAASWTFDLPAEFSIPLRATYTYTGSRFLTGFESEDPVYGTVAEGDEVPYVPSHQGQLQVGLDHERAGVRLAATFVPALREEAGQGDELTTDAFVKLDATGYWWVLSEVVKLELRFENVLDQRPIVARRPFGARSLHPFRAELGAEVNF